MNDLIRRKDVYDIIDKKTVRGKLQVAREVQALPPVDYDISPYADKQKWIPVSERLPESRVYVLVTYEYQYGLIDHGISWYEDKRKEWMSTREVTAWMPLPEPYQAERRNDA